MPKKRILVTGATGFIGGRILERLSNLADYQVIAVGRSLPKSGLIVDKKIQFLVGSLNDPEFAIKATKSVDCVVHCAGLAGAWGSYEDFFKANVELTKTLVAAAKENSCRRFINLSSPSIYFDFKNQLDLQELDLPKKFSNFYARTKFEAEQEVKKAHGIDFETVSLRPRFVIGAGDNTLLPRMIRLRRKRLLFKIGDGKNVVDVTSVSNLVDAVMLCIEAPTKAMGETYNISNAKPILFWSFVDQVLAELKLAPVKMRLPRPLMMGLAKINQGLCHVLGIKKEPALLPVSIAILSQSMTLNTDKARHKLGYVPKQSTEEAIREFSEWWNAKNTSVDTTVNTAVKTTDPSREANRA